MPDEFVVQHNRNANPPTLLLTLHSIVGGLQEEMSDWWRDYLRSGINIIESNRIESNRIESNRI